MRLALEPVKYNAIATGASHIAVGVLQSLLGLRCIVVGLSLLSRRTEKKQNQEKVRVCRVML